MVKILYLNVDADFVNVLQIGRIVKLFFYCYLPFVDRIALFVKKEKNLCVLLVQFVIFYYL